MWDVFFLKQKKGYEWRISDWSSEGCSPDLAEVGRQMPEELSGGMRKRVSVARALALDPELLFLDEPTSRLDPSAAAEFDQLIRTLSDTLGLTVVMVTHDLDSLYSISDRVAVVEIGRAHV